MQFVPKPDVSITQTQNLQWNHHYIRVIDRRRVSTMVH